MRAFFVSMFIIILVQLFYILGAFSIKQLFPLTLVGYEIIIANSVLRLVGYLPSRIQRALVE